MRCFLLQRKCTEAVRVLVRDITHSDRWKSVGCHCGKLPREIQRYRNHNKNPRVCLSVSVFKVSSNHHYKLRQPSTTTTTIPFHFMESSLCFVFMCVALIEISFSHTFSSCCFFIICFCFGCFCANQKKNCPCVWYYRTCNVVNTCSIDFK